MAVSQFSPVWKARFLRSDAEAALLRLVLPEGLAAFAAAGAVLLPFALAADLGAAVVLLAAHVATVCCVAAVSAATTAFRDAAVAWQGLCAALLVGATGVAAVAYTLGVAHVLAAATVAYPLVALLARAVSWCSPRRVSRVLRAVAALLVFCFKQLNLHRVIARSLNDDPASCELFAAAGMRREGEFVKHYFANGEWLNTVWFAMLDEECPAAGI